MKPFWQSKTIWVNVIGGVAAIAQYITPFLTPSQSAIAAGAVSALNVLLRFLTNTGIDANAGSQSQDKNY